MPSGGFPKLLAALAFATLLLSASQAQSTAEVAQLPLPLYGSAALWDPRPLPALGCPSGCAYILGGNDGTQVREEIYRFDPSSGNVTKLTARLPSPRSLLAATWIGDRGYVMGGFPETVSQIVVFRPESDVLVTSRQTLSTSIVYDAAVAAFGPHVYLMGGHEGGSEGRIRVYDTVNDTVRSVTPGLPGPLRGAAAVSDGEDIYLVGGLDASSYRSEILRFDPQEERIEELEVRLPSARAFGSAVWSGRYVYYFGGQNSEGALDSVIRIDVREQLVNVLQMSPLPSPRSYTAAVWNGTGTFVFGGYDEQPALNSILRHEDPLSHIPDPTSSSPIGDEGGNPSGPALRLEEGTVFGLVIGGVVAVVLGAVLVPTLVSRRRSTRPSPLPKASAGREPNRAAATVAATASVALTVRDLRVQAGAQTLLQDVSFELPAGQITFLLGTSGSGKSTMLKALVGLMPFSGTVLLQGQDLRPGSPDFKRRVGFVPQEIQLYPNLTPVENVVYFAGQYNLTGAEAQKAAQQLLAELGLLDRSDAPISRLSGGQQRRASIAAALAHRPAILVLDEPTSGLDFSSRKTLWGMMQGLARKQGVSVLATTHFIDDVQYGDRVGIVYRGRLVTMASPRGLVRSLPGGGRCVEIEFEELEDADRQRLKGMLASLRAKGWVERAEYHTFSVRYFCRDPARSARALPEALYGLNFKVRSTRLDDINLEDVFVYYTGEPLTRPEP